MGDKFAWEKMARARGAKRGRGPNNPPRYRDPLVLRFGKHKGKRVELVPLDYLAWAISAGFIADDSPLGKEATRLIAMPPKKQTHRKQKIPPVSKKPTPKLNFGKFKDRPLDEVPPQYLRWALKKGFLKGFVREQANRLLGNPVSEGKFPSAGPFGPEVERGLDCPFDCPEDEDERRFVDMVRSF